MKSNVLLIIILIVIIAIVGIYFGYNMFFNKPNLTKVSNESISLNNTNSSTNITSSNNYQNITTHTITSSNTTNVNNYQNTSNNYLNNYSNYSSHINVGYNQYIPITIYNNQSISTPSPFQQEIIICKYYPFPSELPIIENETLFNLINANGSNVYFTIKPGGLPDLYSWYEGRLIDWVYPCKAWWIKLPNGIPANSNITIYMYIGNSSSNYYQQYYPYVGVSPQVDSSRQYDNGKYVFIAYGYFNNTMDGWTGYNYSGSWIPRATPYGIQMSNSTYILPPNNWNIPKIPLIVEEAWYGDYCTDANVIALFGNTNQQIRISDYTSTSNLSTFVRFSCSNLKLTLESAVINQNLKSLDIPLNFNSGTIYSYLIINSTYAEAGYKNYQIDQVWVPLGISYLLDDVSESDRIYSNLNYNPFQYGTLQISTGTIYSWADQYIQWVVARAYPPNGVMPRIYIG